MTGPKKNPEKEPEEEVLGRAMISEIFDAAGMKWLGRESEYEQLVGDIRRHLLTNRDEMRRMYEPPLQHDKPS
jgi:hypothetical protein